MDDPSFRLGDHGRCPSKKMIRATFVFLVVITITGCDGERNTKPVNGKDLVLNSQIKSGLTSDSGKWQQLDANQWYDLFELQIADDKSLTCAAFHKTDPQLPIGIVLNLAAIAKKRGYKFIEMDESSPTVDQKRLLENMLSSDYVLVSYGGVRFHLNKPEFDNQVFDVGFLTENLDRNDE